MEYDVCVVCDTPAFREKRSSHVPSVNALHVVLLLYSCYTMPPKKSPVWNYFKEGTQPPVCKLCNKGIQNSGGTSNLAHHLRHHHNIEALPHPAIAGSSIYFGLYNSLFENTCN
jgi:hypothetical protein